MKFDLKGENLWQAHNKALHEGLKLNPLSSVRTYPGISIALTELVRGLVRLFPHRKNFAVLRGAGPFFDDLVDFLSMEGLSRTEFFVEELGQPEEVLKKIPKDCLFLLGSHDDPMTGELFPVEKLFTPLHQNRTFTVMLSHSFHLYRGAPNVQQYMAVVAKYSDAGAIAFLGQRASKIPTLILGPQDWFNPKDWSEISATRSENQTAIEEFEAKLFPPFAPYHAQGTKRLFDRAVVFSDAFDGEACIQLLALHLKLELQSPGEDPSLETLSLCRWNGVNTFNWLLRGLRTSDKMKGVFMIDQALVNQQTLTVLKRVAEELELLQS